MSADAIAADAATTNWRTYDGGIPAQLTIYVVIFPLLMALILALPALACFYCLGAGKRGKIAQYFPPNRRGGGGGHHSRNPHYGTTEYGFEPEKF